MLQVTPTAIVFVLSCAWSLALHPAATAAPFNTASLNGTVRDAAGVSVPGADLVLRNAMTGVSHRGTSNRVGAYTFEEIPAGIYELTVSADGFRPKSLERFSLAGNQATTLSFALETNVPAGPLDAVADEDYRVILKRGDPETRSFSGQPQLLYRREQSVAPPRRGILGSEAEGFCDSYTSGAGWLEPMQLYLGEGAREYLSLIEQAVTAWNIVMARNVIQLQEESVSYSLGSDPHLETAAEFYNDETSVIYFSSLSNTEHDGYNLRWQEMEDETPSQITESDIFIWPQNAGGSEVILLTTIQHEIGHALGLNHTAISGNIMSENFNQAIKDILYPFLSLGLFSGYDSEPQDQDWENFINNSQHSAIIRRLVRPQGQDKSLMLCLYPFKPWGLQ